MTSWLMALAVLAPGQTDIRLAEWGHDPARGVLSGGAIDPARPTVVVVHGINPFDRLVHFTLAERYAETIGRRYGPGVNVVGWNWNGDTRGGLGVNADNRHAIGHGRSLAEALMRAGVDPIRLHLIGHSSGGLIVASAARTLVERTGRPVARLTLLDPASFHHRLIFGDLAVSTAALRVEHYWAPGPSGFGRPAPYRGVIDGRVDGPNRLRGLIRPLHSDHLHVVRWHLGVVSP